MITGTFWLDGGQVLRFHDPRRFGSLHWTEADPALHPLLAKLAPEPLSRAFDGEYLYRATRKRSVAIKHLIMNSQVVVGVGNIYASEALFRAKVSPRRAARRLTRHEAEALAQAIKDRARRSDQDRRHHSARLRQCRRSARIFPPEVIRVRTRGRSLPRVQVRRQAVRPGSALDLLVLELPTLSGAACVRPRRVSTPVPHPRRADPTPRLPCRWRNPR